MNEQLLAVVLGVSILYAFFKAVALQWPDNYFPVGSTLDRAITASPLRFSVFRFLPVFTVCAAAAGMLKNAGSAYLWATMAIALAHVLLTSGRGVLEDARQRRLFLRPIVTIYRLAVGTICLCAGLLAAIVAPWAAHYVPDGRELVLALWTASLAAILGGYVVALSRRPSEHEDISRAFEASRSALGLNLWQDARKAAQRVNADPDLVCAVLLVENLQRPAWSRTLERLAGRITKQGTYGPLQLSSLRVPQSDRAAMEAAIEQLFAGQGPASSAAQYQWLELFLRSYNTDPQWQSDVRAAYDFVRYPRATALASSDASATDHLPVLEVSTFAQSGPSISISGTMLAGPATLLAQQVDGTHAVLGSIVLATHDAAALREGWHGTILLDPKAVSLDLEVHQPHSQVVTSVRIPLLPRLSP
jgi:hypothetical protein